MTSRAGTRAPVSAPLPLVGRGAELATLSTALDDAGEGRGSLVALSGEGGVGKTRLVGALAESAASRGWNVVVGRAYRVETGVPYALFSDAFLPALRGIEPVALQVLTRGGNAELEQLFPPLARGDRPASAPRGDPAEVKSRLLWTFSQFLTRYAAKRPVLLVLENLQWADASSLELLHFVARQLGEARVLIVVTYNDAEGDVSADLRTAERSLVSVGAARALRLAPLSAADTAELVRHAAGAQLATGPLSAFLHERTRGNPFFLEETLKALAERGRLDASGVSEWTPDALDLPRSIRDAVVARVDRLSASARGIANLAAVIGTRASYDALRAVSGLDESALLGALDELRRQHVLEESDEARSVCYDFAHPIVQDALYRELGKARARALHATVAEALEGYHGARAPDHADELAYQYARTDARSLAPKAVRYLAAAGRGALAKYATREAADYLGAALTLLDRSGIPPRDAGAEHLVEDLARARQRLGEYDDALSLWKRARDEASAEPLRVAGIERRMGMASYWSGRYDDALAHYDAALRAAGEAGDDALDARIRLTRAGCLQEVGRQGAAERDVRAALALAEESGDARLLARAHRAMLLFHAWSGPPSLAREHGARAIELSEASGERGVLFSAHWAMAMLEGLNGNASAIAHHLAEAERVADELRSPLLRLWVAEVSVEYASGIGKWTEALALAERTIATARALGQRTLLPRLLVWSAAMYFGRGEIERGKQYVDEAWRLARADTADATDLPRDIHSVVPAHAGLAMYHLATGDYARAIAVGERGLAIADRTGYVAWAIHRLIPTLAEASLWSSDFARAERYGERLRRDSRQLDHRLGLAWADACDALVEMLSGSKGRATSLLRQAADALDAIPFVADGARVRRQLALALAETGDREAAARELRRVHDVFASLGAERELAATRDQLRHIGSRPPTRASTEGAAGLTGRELEIARLVAARKSNKDIGAELDISARTVSTHLSNIFAKLDVASRGELTDLIRATAPGD